MLNIKYLMLLLAPLAGWGQSVEKMVITHVNVVDVENSVVLGNQHVVIERGRIQAVTNAGETPVPHGIPKVRGRGQYLIPGLIDSHLHLGQYTTQNRPVLDHALQLLLTYGITGFRDAGFMTGLREFIQLRDSIDQGLIQAPKIYISGLPMAYQRNGAESPAYYLDTLYSMGVNGIKIKRANWGQARQIIEKAGKYHLPVYGHTYDAFQPDTFNFLGDFTPQAIRAGAVGVMHLSGHIPLPDHRFPQRSPGVEYSNPDRFVEAWRYTNKLWLYVDQESEKEYIDLFKLHHTWLEPTLGIESVQCHWQDWINSPGAQYNMMGVPMDTLYQSWMLVPETTPDQDTACLNFERMLLFIRHFHEQGGMLLAGTDNYLYGSSLIEELKWMEKAGIPPLDILRIATLNNARALNWDQQVGSIKAGKIASLILLDKNPATTAHNLTSLRAVILNGRLISRKEIRKLQEKVRRFAKTRQSGK